MNDVEITDFTLAFKTVAVRDLAWVMSSPGLITSSTDKTHIISDDWCQQTYSAHLETLRNLDENPQPLLDYLSDLKNHRLGFYFEMLLAFWLENILGSQPFRKNVPVFQKIENAGRKTIGEFDFLFGQAFGQTRQPTLNHWEVTIKFYLYHEGAAGEPRWLGPAGRDRLDAKLTRIFEHQLKLAETPEGGFEVGRISSWAVDAAAFIKGYLFYPVALGEGGSELERNPKLYSSFGVSPDHLHGWWLRHGETDFPRKFLNSRWLVLPKLRWLSTAWCAGDEPDQLLDDEGVRAYCSAQFAKGHLSLLFAEMQPGIDGWFEVSRGFIVAPDWPIVD